MSLGLAVFDELCASANRLEELRDTCLPSSDGWVALTEVLQAFDTLIDTLVGGAALDGEDGAEEPHAPSGGGPAP